MVPRKYSKIRGEKGCHGECSVIAKRDIVGGVGKKTDDPNAAIGE